MAMAYCREDIYDEKTTAEIARHYREILRLIGEDPEREGLVKTPERVAKAMCFLMQGYQQNPAAGQGTFQPNTPSAAGQAVCPNCGASVPAGSKFCLSCGEKMVSNAAFCPNCGRPLPAGAKFCSECGSKVQ